VLVGSSARRRRPAGGVKADTWPWRGEADEPRTGGTHTMSPRGHPFPVIGPPRQKGRLKDELRALKSLTPYLWPRDSFGLRVRVVLALVFLLAGKLVNIGVPLLYKEAVDALSPAKVVIAAPVALIVAYGLARVMSQGFNELRNA